MIKAITHTTIYDFHRYLENAYVIFDEQIIDVGLMKDFIDHDYTIIDGKDHLILPG